MKRNASLDFMKVIASILIVCHHFQQVLEVHFGRVNFYGGRFSYGYLVELFFIISGICAFQWIEKMTKEWTFPIYYHVKGYWRLDQPFSMSGALFACLGIQAGWASNNPMINNPIWYISVLLLCYAIIRNKFAFFKFFFGKEIHEFLCGNIIYEWM